MAKSTPNLQEIIALLGKAPASQWEEMLGPFGLTAEQREEVLAKLGGLTTQFIPTPNPTRPSQEQTTHTLPLSSAPDPMIDQMIGPFRLLELLGEGGFGEVYLAEQRRPISRRVAIKIIKPGMDSRQVIARFEVERQGLAMMDHPNIAKVLDAGTTAAGRPYFVMEHVKGEPITAYCDKQRLTLRQRLELFEKVCDAVQHAHMKGIIHRDLKPSNILVAAQESSSSARPVIIDFGVAKATAQRLTDQTMYTQQGVLIGTPEYMSPEQAEMSEADIDTRTDIYALGVILYELLTGALPFDPKTLREAGFAAIQKMIREKEPPRPSTRLSTMGEKGSKAAEARQVRLEDLSKELKNELEWIPLKAIRKDRTERYRSAAELGDDIGNYLADRPLMAGPESAAYQLRKLLRRNRGPAAAAAILLTLLMGIGGTLWKAREARREAWAAHVAEAEQRRLAGLEASARQEAEEKRAIADRKTQEANQARDQALFEAYRANIMAADSSVAANEMTRVRTSLDAAPPAMRGWEWNWINARSDMSIARLEGHVGRVMTAAFSPDRKRIVTASHDGTARVWDVASGKELLVLKHLHPMTPTLMALNPVSDGILALSGAVSVNSAAFSPDGMRIVTVAVDGTVRAWDAVTGKELVQFQDKEGPSFAGYSSDGRLILTASDSGPPVRSWDAKTGLAARDAGAGPFPSFGRWIGTPWRPCELVGGGYIIDLRYSFQKPQSISRDGGRMIWMTPAQDAQVVELATGKEVAEFHQAGGISCAELSPDGSKAAIGSYAKTVHLMDVASRNELLTLRHTSWVSLIQFTPDGSRMLTVSPGDGTGQLWDARTGDLLMVLRHPESVESAGLSADGSMIVSTAMGGHGVRVWDVRTREMELRRELRRKTHINSAAISRDGTRILTTSSDRGVRVFDAATGEKLLELLLADPHFLANFTAQFSADGWRIVTVAPGGVGRVWETATGRLLAVQHQAAKVLASDLNPDGTQKVAFRIDLGGGKRMTFGRERNDPHGMVDCCCAFSPDGSRIASASPHEISARVWDSSTGEEVMVLPHDRLVTSIAFSADGKRIITTAEDSSARLWDARTGKELLRLRNFAGFYSAALSPDGRRIVTASADSIARVWDVQSQKVVLMLEHDGRVNDASFSPDGSRILTASSDKSARVWDARTGRELCILRHDEPVHSATFCADGTRILSLDLIVRIWDGRPYRERFPIILRKRLAGAKMKKLVEAALASGKTPEQITQEITADDSLSGDERMLGLAAVRFGRGQAGK